MYRPTRILLALSFPFVLTLSGWAGDGESAALIEKAIKAHFPKGLDTKNQGVRTKAKGTLHVMGVDLEFTQEVSVQAASKFKEVMQLNVMNKDITVTTVFNGKEGWIRTGDKDVDVTAEMLDEFKEAVYSIGLMQGLFLKDKSVKFSLLGEVQVKGKPALGLTLSRKGKKDISVFFDKGTGLISKVEMRKRDFMSGQEVTEERFILEYQDQDGRKVAKKVEVVRDGSPLMEAEVTSVQIFEKIDDGEFVQPK